MPITRTGRATRAKRSTRAADALPTAVAPAAESNAEHTAATQPLLLSPASAARALSLSRASLYVLLTTRKLESFSIGARRVIPVSAIERYIERELAAAGTASNG